MKEASVKYVASKGGEPRVKLISAAPGTLFTARPTGAPHHCSYWVEDLDESTASLKDQGWREEATGLGEDAVARYRYLVNGDGHRVELGLFQHRAEFDDWADA